MGKKEFAEALAGESEVTITVVRSKNGKSRTIPVWFTVEGGRLQLLPMYGLKTKWFQDIKRRGTLDLQLKQRKMGAAPDIVKDAARVDRIKRNFAQKYGAADVKRYYPTSEVALEIAL